MGVFLEAYCVEMYVDAGQRKTKNERSGTWTRGKGESHDTYGQDKTSGFFSQTSSIIAVSTIAGQCGEGGGKGATWPDVGEDTPKKAVKGLPGSQT